MKQILYFLCTMTLFSNALPISAQVNIVVEPDSVYVAVPVEEYEINLPSQITNNTGDTVTIRWTRVIEQKPEEWGVNFCDKSVCHSGTVESKTFDLAVGESGLLEPIFYPNEVAGTGVFRLYLQSETPGVTWADTAVFVGVAGDPAGINEVELVRDVTVFPNPATDMLDVVTADVYMQGRWRITDAAGKVWASSNSPVAIAGQIPVDQLPAGLYFLNIMTSDGRHAGAKRFTVQR